MAATEPAENHDAEQDLNRPLSGRQLALARSRAYGLISQLYLNGVTPGNLGQVRAVPELAQRLASPFVADEAAADHQHLFGFNVHPYQSLFLDPAGLLGGPVTESVAQRYNRLGFDPGTAAESADHIGFEIGLLAFLCAAEFEAIENGRPDNARQVRKQQFVFLNEHLLPWIAPLTLAIGQQELPFYDALADVTLDLLQEQAAEMEADLGRPSEDGPTQDGAGLPVVPDLLRDEKTGLKEIADFLLRPSYSGIYLSRDDIGRLARRQAIPRGFGDRRLLLLNLLRSAANYDALGEIVDDLGGVARRWQVAYAEMVTRPGIGAFAPSWRSRAEGTAALLAQMGSRIEDLV